MEMIFKLLDKFSGENNAENRLKIYDALFLYLKSGEKQQFNDVVFSSLMDFVYLEMDKIVANFETIKTINENNKNNNQNNNQNNKNNNQNNKPIIVLDQSCSGLEGSFIDLEKTINENNKNNKPETIKTIKKRGWQKGVKRPNLIGNSYAKKTINENNKPIIVLDQSCSGLEGGFIDLENNKTETIKTINENNNQNNKPIIVSTQSQSGVEGGFIDLKKTINKTINSENDESIIVLDNVEVVEEAEIENEFYVSGDEPQNDIEKRAKAFGLKIGQYVDEYGKEMCRAFYNYWTERNEGGKKMRFEKEKTFEIKKRLARWNTNNKNYKNGTNRNNNQQFGQQSTNTNARPKTSTSDETFARAILEASRIREERNGDSNSDL